MQESRVLEMTESRLTVRMETSWALCIVVPQKHVSIVVDLRSGYALRTIPGKVKINFQCAIVNQVISLGVLSICWRTAWEEPQCCWCLFL